MDTYSGPDNLTTNIHCINTFAIGPRQPWGKPHLLEKTPTTIGYMELDHVLYFAKNGKHVDTDSGCIEGRYWSEQAKDLFLRLGSGLGHSYFQHVELQLMALYVSKFCEREGLSMSEFADAKMLPRVRESDTKRVDILVSQAVCWACKEHVELMNKTLKRSGFSFWAEDRYKRSA
ncbi:hypothetical protein CC86DRAFT_21307 [Ophiobolus disseminans]|uniref:Uncharacterized protein n=1 Tax=Ophiobolus disseminans TaxID=1469910 RepID=A0A6A7A2B7_9PLEO|nr:hypothetical protein CC86DRAFT_21307 [Ophiobolus disseminans]